MTQIKIIPHTHWDKEWYFTSARSRVYSLADFDEILDVLEQEGDFTYFHLDGQLSIVEEYLAWHPYRSQQFSSLVKKGKLIIGPWYTQPDTLVISGENLIKNLELGIKLSQAYGPYQKIGYLPDSFGMSGQMPQIYRQFELDYAFFRRGTARHLLTNREFLWQGIDGSKIFTHHLHHYGNMAYPPNNPDALVNYFIKMVEMLEPTGNTDIILLFNGEDQKPIRRNLPELVGVGNEKTSFEIEISELSQALQDLEKYYAAQPEKLPKVTGEFTFGQESRTHKSIFSTRADLKQLNNQLENFMTNQLLPISSLAFTLGMLYENKALESIWKNLLLNSAHDSIGNCNSDATNRDIEARYVQGYQVAKELAEFKLREVGQRVIQKDITQFQVYNLLPYERGGICYLEMYSPYQDFRIMDSHGNACPFVLVSIEDVTETYLKKSKKEIGVDNAEDGEWATMICNLYKVSLGLQIQKMPSFGYTTLILKEAQKESHSIATAQTFIDNDFYRLELVNDNINLSLKQSQATIENWVRVLDDGDEGDSYDYSQPDNDWQCWAQWKSFELKVNNLYQEMILAGDLELPKHLDERANKIATIQQSVSLCIRLEANNPYIQLKLKTTNRVDEHRLRLVFNTNQENATSFADTQFGTIQRPVYLAQEEVWQEEGWDEKPRTIDPLISFVTNGFGQGKTQIITEAVREYQFIGEGYRDIAMTVYRSTPFLGKRHLNDRPGRESGTMAPTPDARLMDKKIEATYYCRVMDANVDVTECAQGAKECLTPLIAYQAAQYRNNTDNFVLSQSQERNLPLEYSLFSLRNDQVLSTVEKADDTSSSLLIRSFNPSSTEKCALCPPHSNYWGQAKLVNLLGNPVEFQDELRPCQFVTWKTETKEYDK